MAKELTARMLIGVVGKQFEEHTQSELRLLAFVIVLLVLFYIGGCICDYRERKREKEERRECRHFYDLDKQQETDDMEKLYYEIILNEISE